MSVFDSLKNYDLMIVDRKYKELQIKRAWFFNQALNSINWKD